MKKVIKGRCLNCYELAAFETWQYYNIKSEKKDKHEFAGWCSNRCLSIAEGWEHKVSNKNKGKYHRHNASSTCAGEFENKRG